MIHDLRVQLRRLRSALRMFAPLIGNHTPSFTSLPPPPLWLTISVTVEVMPSVKAQRKSRVVPVVRYSVFQSGEWTVPKASQVSHVLFFRGAIEDRELV